MSGIRFKIFLGAVCLLFLFYFFCCFGVLKPSRLASSDYLDSSDYLKENVFDPVKVGSINKKVDIYADRLTGVIYAEGMTGTSDDSFMPVLYADGTPKLWDFENNCVLKSELN